jgi:ABC-type polar amino acid transport system ATPase subunit
LRRIALMRVAAAIAADDLGPAGPSTTHETIVQFQGVNKSYGVFPVLRDIDLEIKTGGVVVICGPSGSGKSTLLRCINGLERINAGRITVMGRELTDAVLASPEFRAEIGFVFQKFSLYPHMTVLQNLTFAPRKVRKMPRLEANARAQELLARVGLSGRDGAYPGELSGGQQQRVAIVRALIMQPKLMLFDEPTSALDPEMIREVLDVMRDLARTGITMVVVTHEMGFAREVADHIVFMEEGQIIEATPTKDFFGGSPSLRAQKFLDRVLHH